MDTRAPLPGRPMAWAANNYRTIYIDYKGRNRERTIEAEFYYDLYEQGGGYVHLCCPLCQTGTMEDAPVQVEGDTQACTLTIRREKKYFEVDSNNRLTVQEPITCTYCGMWSVWIRNGVAHDSI